MIKLEMCFECDPPTTVEEALKDAFPPSHFGHFVYHRMSARQLGEKLPRIIPWLARQGLMADNYELIITRTPDEEVEKPVVQSDSL